MKKLLIGTGLVTVILIAGVAIAPSLVPSEVYKDKIQTQLSTELGRDVSIEGDVTLSVFPTIKAKTGRVTIANAEGFEADYFARMDGLDAQVKLWPLFRKQVEIKAFDLKSPDIRLEKNNTGDVNWRLGVKDETTATPPADTGPFKRDGRYNDLDPRIGRFAITDGAISYTNKTTDVNYALTDANLNFTLTRMDAPLDVKGDFVLNGTPLSTDLRLDTPRAFLNGQEATVSFVLKSEFAEIDADGKFLEGEDLNATATLKSSLSDMQKLASFLPKDIPYTELVNTATMSGLFSYDDGILTATKSDINVKGPNIALTYMGGARLSDTPTFDGQLSADLSNVATLLTQLGHNIQGLDTVETAKISATLASITDGFQAQNVKADITGDDLSMTFTGSGTYKDDLVLRGPLTAQLGSIPALIKRVGQDIPQAAVLGAGDITGDLVLNGSVVTIEKLTAKLSDGQLNGAYTGKIIYNETPRFDGTFNLNAASVPTLLTMAGISSAYASSLGKMDVSGRVNGSPEALALTDIDAKLTDGQLNATYTGRIDKTVDVSLSGILDANIPSVRALATSVGTALPPNTDSGKIYDVFSIGGQVSGTPDTLNFENADIVLDDLRGSGKFTYTSNANRADVNPYVSGKIDLSTPLDLRPYMASYATQNPTGEIQPWSDDALNLSMLKLLDGDFALTTDKIITDRLSLGASNIQAKLKGGVLQADIPNLSLYGGEGTLKASVDASTTVPKVAMTANIAQLNSENFLGAVAGFSRASGQGGVTIDISGSGRTQSEIMNSLNGNGNFQVLNGAIGGIDLGQFLGGIEEAFTSRSLPSGLGANYTTDFKDLIGKFSIENGIAKVGNFDLTGSGVAAEGFGQVDLGAQSIDFSLRPRLTGTNANDLAAFGIPLRLSGGFGDVSAGLDTELLGKIVAQKAQSRARDEAQKLLKDKVGDSAVGNILGSVLGGSGTSESSSSETPTKAQEQTKPEDALGAILGGLSQRQKDKSSDTTSKDEDAETAKEPTVEDALLGLFGSKRKKKSEESD